MIILARRYTLSTLSMRNTLLILLLSYKLSYSSLSLTIVFVILHNNAKSTKDKECGLE